MSMDSEIAASAAWSKLWHLSLDFLVFHTIVLYPSSYTLALVKGGSFYFPQNFIVLIFLSMENVNDVNVL